MADDGAYTLCPYCSQRVEPDDPGVVYAVEQREILAFGSREIVDGIGGFFHPGCRPRRSAGFAGSFQLRPADRTRPQLTLPHTLPHSDLGGMRVSGHVLLAGLS